MTQGLYALAQRVLRLIKFGLRIYNLTIWRAMVHESLDDDRIDAPPSRTLTVGMPSSVGRGAVALAIYQPNAPDSVLQGLFILRDGVNTPLFIATYIDPCIGMIALNVGDLRHVALPDLHEPKPVGFWIPVHMHIPTVIQRRMLPARVELAPYLVTRNQAIFKCKVFLS